MVMRSDCSTVYNGTVSAFAIDPDAGTLRATGCVAAVPTPVCLQLLGR
jgi:6-phosphogluconolactonase (cycloisomerase 2 family)